MTVLVIMGVCALWIAVAAAVVSLCVLSSRSDRAQDTAEFDPIELPGAIELPAGLMPNPH